MVADLRGLALVTIKNAADFMCAMEASHQADKGEFDGEDLKNTCLGLCEEATTIPKEYHTVDIQFKWENMETVSSAANKMYQWEKTGKRLGRAKSLLTVKEERRLE